MFADSHAHIDMAQFDSDREEVLRRAVAAGVELIVGIGTGNPTESSIERTLELCDHYDFVFAGIGVHPHDARLVDEAYWQRMLSWCAHPKVVLWGEIGLDYYYDYSPRERQRDVFRRQLCLARERRLPVSIHCRNAWDDLLPILEEEWFGGNRRGIIHSFTGSAEQARACANQGFMISFSGIVTFKNAEPLRQAARSLRMDEILVETDSPYLTPVPHRGKRNEPAYVVDVTRGLAQALSVSVEDLALHTTRNIRKLLNLDGVPSQGKR